MHPPFPHPEDLALWRYGIISSLLHQQPDGPPLCAQIEEVAQRVYYTPDGREKRFCCATIRHWRDCYLAAGIDGLADKPRKDRGISFVPQTLQQALADLRKQQPDWTVKRLLDEVARKGLWNRRKPSRSALYRFTAANDLGRNPLKLPSPVRSFEYPFFGDLWSADFLHGPKVRRGTHEHKVYLHAIIDDATRLIVAARFHEAEDTKSMLDDLMLAVRRFGVPKRLYTDNGAAFRSRHLRMVAARLAIALPHTPAYTPQGRGKIERFFRTVRDGFLTGRARTSLAKLNADFAHWLNEYHHRPHNGLGISPLERKETDTGPELRQIPPTQNIDLLFAMEEKKRVGSDGCIRLFKKRFEIPNALPRSSVTVSYLPWETNRIFLEPDKTPLIPLDTHKNARRFDKPRRGTQTNTNKKENDQ